MAVRFSQVFGKYNSKKYYTDIMKMISACMNNKITFKEYSTSSINKNETVKDDEKLTQKKKKTTPIPRITLLQGDAISVTTLEEAYKLSKRRDLKLVKLIDLDTKSQRPIYKLMTASEYHEEDIKQREQKKTFKEGALKGEKLVMLSYNIANHDLEVHIKKIEKWIQKFFEVKVIINGDASKIHKAEEVYNTMEQSLLTIGRIVQKRTKGSDIKFQVIPPKKDEKNDTDKIKEKSS